MNVTKIFKESNENGEFYTTCELHINGEKTIEYNEARSLEDTKAFFSEKLRPVIMALASQVDITDKDHFPISCGVNGLTGEDYGYDVFYWPVEEKRCGFGTAQEAADALSEELRVKAKALLKQADEMQSLFADVQEYYDSH